MNGDKVKYHARQSGTEFGPMNERELKTLAMHGLINASGEVRSDEFFEWKPANEIPIISHLLRPEKIGEREALEGITVNESATPDRAREACSVKVVDINMPFNSMVVFMVKWALASIPAILILSIVLGVVLWFGSKFARL